LILGTPAEQLERTKDPDIRVAEYSGTQTIERVFFRVRVWHVYAIREDRDKAEAWTGNTSDDVMKREESSRPAFSSARASNIPRASGLVDLLQVSDSELTSCKTGRI
jgi:hypothetical protein